MLWSVNCIKARRIYGPPFDPKRDEIDEYRIAVAREINLAAEWAVMCLRDRGEFDPEPETAALRWSCYTARHLRFRGEYFEIIRRESMKIWTHEPWLFHFHTHVRQFSLDAGGQIWSQRFFRDWAYQKDVIVSFPLGNITDCWFRTDVLAGELLPALERLGGV